MPIGGATPGARAWSKLGLAALLLWGCACLPPELDELGLKCSVDRPCSADLDCVQGHCAPKGTRPDGGIDAGHDAGMDGGFDAGTDAGGLPVDQNLLVNPDFEQVLDDGGSVGWRAQPGVLTVSDMPRRGQHAVRVRGNNSLVQSGLVPLVEPVRDVPQQLLFCARAFVRADTQRTVRAVLFIREKYPDAGVKGAIASTAAFCDGGSQWLEVKQSLSSTVPGGLIDIKVQVNEMLDAGEALLVDDALLYLSSDGLCSLP